MGRLGGAEWLIIILLVVLLFGAKRLPDAARGIGRSLRIFKAETKGLIEDGKDQASDEAATAMSPTASAATNSAQPVPQAERRTETPPHA